MAQDNITSENQWSAGNAEERLQRVLATIDEAPASARHVFTEQLTDEARADVAALPGKPHTPLSGALITIKDLFDVAGRITRAGTQFQSGNAPARRDADIVARLRAAGGIIYGKTNMTELAYGGLGLNNHYGTPETPLKPGGVPGGSTSGGAVSIALGLADVTIGTDTGGSCRVPAAFCGITGLKPSQQSISRAGCQTLSQTLDSVGPLAKTADVCESAWRVMSGVTESLPQAAGRLVIPTTYGMDDLAPEVAAGFSKAIAQLETAGFTVVEQPVATLADYADIRPWLFTAVEACALYNAQYVKADSTVDPRVLGRMRLSEGIFAVEYRMALEQRDRLVKALGDELGDDMLLLPTCPITAPLITDVAEDDDYYRINALALRNTTVGNILNGCSITLPFGEGADTIGVMLTAPNGRDLPLLANAKRAEAALA